MDAVGNEFRPDSRIGQNRAQNSGVPMVEIAHRIECMSRIGRASLDRLARDLEGCVGVAERNDNPFERMCSINSTPPGFSGASVISFTWPFDIFSSSSKMRTEGFRIYSGGCTPRFFSLMKGPSKVNAEDSCAVDFLLDELSDVFYSSMV